MNTTEKITEAAESISDDKLRAIMQVAVAQLAGLMATQEPNILQALHVAAEEEEDAVSFGFTIKLELNTGKQKGKLSIGIRRTEEAICDLPDPDQPELFDDYV